MSRTNVRNPDLWTAGHIPVNRVVVIDDNSVHMVREVRAMESIDD